MFVGGDASRVELLDKAALKDREERIEDVDRDRARRVCTLEKSGIVMPMLKLLLKKFNMAEKDVKLPDHAFDTESFDGHFLLPKEKVGQ